LILSLFIFKVASALLNSGTISKDVDVSRNPQTNGCSCNVTECSCCDSTKITKICLESKWNQKAQSIETKVEIGGISIGDVSFTELNSSHCLSFTVGSVCIAIANLSMVSDGACGCWDIQLKMFGIDIDVNLGCFTFGNGANCKHVLPCGTYSSCQECSSHQNCGWCQHSKSCIEGNQSSPTSGTCKSGWSFQHC